MWRNQQYAIGTNVLHTNIVHTNNSTAIIDP
jgi:hypothetical protein